MKKNKLMRAASILLVATLISTCAISGTFAKYVTSETTANTARVAKWGVTVSATGDLFGQYYESVGNGNTVITASYTAGTDTYATVESGNSDKVVAPGTTGSILTGTLSGTPEVDYTIGITNAAVTLTGWTLADTTVYCPIQFTIGGTTYTCDTTLAAFESALETALNAVSVSGEAGTSVNANLPAISWSWPFEVAGNDAKDTYLGDQAAAGNASTIAVQFDIIVTQVD